MKYFIVMLNSFFFL
jgi:chromosome segregation ATPase